MPNVGTLDPHMRRSTAPNIIGPRGRRERHQARGKPYAGGRDMLNVKRGSSRWSR